MARARKRLGQHFLHHRAILERIADALDAPPGAPVLEVGPGHGALTRVLAERGTRVTAIEKDRELAALVEKMLPQVRVIAGDALEVDWRAAAGADPDEAIFVVGNIPYNITSPLLAKALAPPRPERIVFLVQEEVADRIGALPGGASYGALSVGIRSVARAEKLFRVPAGAFHPRPKVDSAVVRISPIREPLIGDQDLESFRRLVVGLFGFRRKQLGRGLREFTSWSPERVGTVLDRAGIPASVRPETVAPEGFAELYRVLIDAGWRRQ